MLCYVMCEKKKKMLMNKKYLYIKYFGTVIKKIHQQLKIIINNGHMSSVLKH